MTDVAALMEALRRGEPIYLTDRLADPGDYSLSDSHVTVRRSGPVDTTPAGGWCGTTAVAWPTTRTKPSTATRRVSASRNGTWSPKPFGSARRETAENLSFVAGDTATEPQAIVSPGKRLTRIPPPSWARNTGEVISRTRSVGVLVNISVANASPVGAMTSA